MSDAFYSQHDGPICIHTFLNSSETAVDAWGIALAHLIDATPLDKKFLVLMDVSSPQVSFTRYARQKTLDLFTRYKNRQGKIAFLFTSKTAPHFARIFFASLDRLTFDCQYFSNRTRAMSWLHDGEQDHI
jgi:hypothetical protein